LDTTLGARLKELRQGSSQAAFARKLGVSPSAIGQYERGEQLPGAAFLMAVSRHYNVSIDWLLFGEGPKYPTAGVTAEHLEHQADQELKTWLESEGVTDQEALAEGMRLDKNDSDEFFKNLSLGRMVERLVKENGELKLENLKLSMQLDTARQMCRKYYDLLQKRNDAREPSAT
jgi:transcriptional regulator with XRE-family HTH domain